MVSPRHNTKSLHEREGEENRREVWTEKGEGRNGTKREGEMGSEKVGAMDTPLPRCVSSATLLVQNIIQNSVSQLSTFRRPDMLHVYYNHF